VGQPADELHPPHDLLAVSVWFEPGHERAFRARVRTLGSDGQMTLVGVTSSREEVTEMVGQWLEALDAE
jgi:hypothetical protein